MPEPTPTAIDQTYPELSVGARCAHPLRAKVLPSTAMTPDDFVAALRELGPGPRSVVDVHLRDHGEVLLHLLAADLRRLLLISFEQGDDELLNRSLALVDRALQTGDEKLRNAVAVSFVEDTGWWEPSMRAFIESWPPGLRAELERQEKWLP